MRSHVIVSGVTSSGCSATRRSSFSILVRATRSAISARVDATFSAAAASRNARAFSSASSSASSSSITAFSLRTDPMPFILAPRRGNWLNASRRRRAASFSPGVRSFSTAIDAASCFSSPIATSHRRTTATSAVARISIRRRRADSNRLASRASEGSPEVA